jgi:hypothetical protein
MNAEYVVFLLIGLLLGLLAYTATFLFWLGSMAITNHPFLPV